MENWQKGDVAICIDTGDVGGNPAYESPPLRKDAEYIVSAVAVCPCGNVTLDVGIGTEPNARNHCSCGRNTSGDSIWWCAARRFVKKQSMEEQIAEALSKEDYLEVKRLKEGNL